MAEIKHTKKRHHLNSMLMRESMLDKAVMAATESPVIRMLPEAHVIKIGGRSVMEGGRDLCYAVVDVLREILDKDKLILSTGGGTMRWNTTQLGIGLPKGIRRHAEKDHRLAFRQV